MKLYTVHFTRPDGTAGYDASFSVATATRSKELMESWGYVCGDPEEYEMEKGEPEKEEPKPKRIIWDKSEIKGLSGNVGAAAKLEGCDYWIQSVQFNLTNQLSDFRKEAQKVGAGHVLVRLVENVLAEDPEADIRVL